MTDEPEITDEELERRMRRKLFFNGPSSRQQKLSDVEQRIAEKLIGKDNTDRLQKRRPDHRPFRPAPVSVHFEYYWLDGGQYSMGCWKIVRIENGRSTDHEWQHDDFNAEIAMLKRKGYAVREFVVGAVASKSSKPAATGNRKTFSERFGALPIGDKR